MTLMKLANTFRDAAAAQTVLVICLAAMLSLAVAMGVGRFAFTPLFPLMVRDGLLNAEAGALLAASNYLGYLAGAMLAGRIRVAPAALLGSGLLGTVLVTAAVGWTLSVPAWAMLRFLAGVLSAWTLVATTTWALEWLGTLGRPQLAGVVFAGVGLGIAGAGMFCLVAASRFSANTMWVALGVLSVAASLLPWIASRRYRAPATHAAKAAVRDAQRHAPAATRGLVICYSLFGFGYILPATYLPALARQLVDDPQVFGWAWPVFGTAAAVSTVVVSFWLRKFDRMRVWAASHVLMAAGVALPIVWSSLASVVIAALLVGGTFMVITMVAMQEARARAEHDATRILASMTAGFALGQLLGPLVSALLGRFTPDYATALDWALALASAGLVASAIHLLYDALERHPLRTQCHG
jgi:MFS family permease